MYVSCVYAQFLDRLARKESNVPKMNGTPHYGQRGGPNKMTSRCMLLTMKSIYKNTLMKKDPSGFRKPLEQWFLRPELIFFLEFPKHFLFTLSVLKKDPSHFRKHPEQWFLRPDLIFFGILKKKIIHHNRYLQNDH